MNLWFLWVTKTPPLIRTTPWFHQKRLSRATRHAASWRGCAAAPWPQPAPAARPRRQRGLRLEGRPRDGQLTCSPVLCSPHLFFSLYDLYEWGLVHISCFLLLCACVFFWGPGKTVAFSVGVPWKPPKAAPSEKTGTHLVLESQNQFYWRLVNYSGHRFHACAVTCANWLSGIEKSLQ